MGLFSKKAKPANYSLESTLSPDGLNELKLFIAWRDQVCPGANLFQALLPYSLEMLVALKGNKSQKTRPIKK